MMAEPLKPRKVTSSGLGVDAYGPPVIDPTANVISLVDAAILRQDDLRSAESRHIRELMQLHTNYNQQLNNLRDNYSSQLRVQEAERLNAIRLFDTAASARASEVAGTQAATLAGQVQAAAEAMRNQVAAAAAAAAASLVTALEPIQSSINDLRKAQYEQQGQRVAQSEGKDTSQWIVGLVVGIIGAFIVGLSMYYITKP